MQTSKAVIIGLVVLVAAAVLGLGISSMMNDDTEVASSTNTTSQTESSEMTMENESAKTITTLAVETESLSTLEAAVVAAGLADTLNDPNAKFTVFAPSNDAFGKLPAGTVETLVMPESKDALTNILTYHVVPTVAMAADLSDGQTLTTVQGETLTVNIEDGKVFIVDAKGGSAQVTTADVKASNGVVHIIDNVLMPS